MNVIGWEGEKDKREKERRIRTNSMEKKMDKWKVNSAIQRVNHTCITKGHYYHLQYDIYLLKKKIVKIGLW